MKRIVIFMIVLYCTNAINAQEKVGINTTNPQAQLHIIGDSIILEDGVTNESLRFSAQEFWQVIKSSNKLVINPKDENGEVVIGDYISGSGNSILSILSDSMGVLLPKLTTLEIANIDIGMGDEGLLLYNTDTNGFEYYNGMAWSSIGGGTGLWNQNASDIYYDSGNVGIGTITPATPLDVVGDITFRGNRVDFKAPNSTASIFAITDNGSDIYLGANRNNADLYIQADQDIKFRTEDGSYTEKMVIKENGFVGIGTDTPNGHLDVKGNIVVNNENNSGLLVFNQGAGADAIIGAFPGTNGINLSFNNFNPEGDIHLVTPDTIRMVVGGNVNVLTDNGDFGIGTTDPVEKLDVDGAIKLGTTSNSNLGAIRYDSDDFEGYTNGGWESLTDKDDADSDPANEIQVLSISGQDLSLSNGGGTVTIPSGGGGSSPWNVNGNDIDYTAGNVGIGNATPAEKLDVTGNAIISGDITSNGDLILNRTAPTASIISFQDNGITQSQIFHNGTNTVMNNTTTGGNMYLSADNDIFLNGLSGENVGIGTTSPSEKLDVNGNIKLTGTDRSIKHSTTLNINSMSEDSTTVMITPNVPSSNGKSTLLLAEDDDGTFGMGWQFDGPTNILKLIGKTNTSINDTIMHVQRVNGHIALGGNFATGYRLSVDGKIICEELQVELKVGWPDYVFEKDYNLMPLNQVKRFIQTNGHLPNIPSAQNIKEEGLSVGEMNRLLMEKVEELTLHLIRMEEKNIELKKDFETLKLRK